MSDDLLPCIDAYLLTGRHGLFNTYEAFVHIVATVRTCRRSATGGGRRADPVETRPRDFHGRRGFFRIGCGAGITARVLQGPFSIV
jgi:D-xylulose 5-phosphate/D-fructose 6-phosphate phosphoketolase